jgi:hypothetical protein
MYMERTLSPRAPAASAGIALLACLGSVPVAAQGTAPDDTLFKLDCFGNVPCFDSTADLPLADYEPDATRQTFIEASADQANGTLTATVTYTQDAGEFANDGRFDANARDRFTVSGPMPGSTVEITARLRMEGAIAYVGLVSVRAATVEAVVSSSVDGWDPAAGVVNITGADSLQSGPGVNLPDVEFELEATDTFNVTVGTPFQFAYRMDLDGGQAGGSGERSAELAAVATLSFDLPAGYSITSELGYSDAPAPVPALSVGMLTGLCGGLLGVVALVLRARTRSGLAA